MNTYKPHPPFTTSPPDPERCAAAVYSSLRGMTSKQCARRRTAGKWCAQHAKKAALLAKITGVRP